MPSPKDSPPTPVEVKNEEPLPVAVVGPIPTTDRDSTAQVHARSRAASARVDAEALMSIGQRRINLIWEVTQAAIALTVVGLTAIGMFIGRIVEGNAVPFPPEWWTIVGLVIGFYFSRTNHQKVGGVGGEDVQLGR